MEIAIPEITANCPESTVYERLLSLDGKHILELGCGNAEITRDIATTGTDRRITALEVDRIAHENNLRITDLPNVAFALGGAEAIPLDDSSVDVVLMFKSLHHVPVDLMEPSLREIHRVLKPGGQAYISEPVFAGEFNEILRLFHDEQKVREAAFDTLKHAVDSGLFTLIEEVFFNTPMAFDSFEDFENRVIKVTHTEHKLDASVYNEVRKRFEANAGDDGARFLTPIRVDLLQKAAG